MNFDQAVQDLLWLEKRFKNIMAAVPELTKFSSLSNAITEREALLQEKDGLLRASLEKLQEISKSVADLTVEKAELESEIQANETEAQAKLESYTGNMLGEAQVRYDSIIAEAEQEKAKVDLAIEEKNKELTDLQEAVSVQQKIFDDIQKKIAELKSRL